jgi:hypothetical protein
MGNEFSAMLQYYAIAAHFGAEGLLEVFVRPIQRILKVANSPSGLATLVSELLDVFGGEEVLSPGLGGPSRGHHTTEHRPTLSLWCFLSDLLIKLPTPTAADVTDAGFCPVEEDHFRRGDACDCHR